MRGGGGAREVGAREKEDNLAGEKQEQGSVLVEELAHGHYTMSTRR